METQQVKQQFSWLASVLIVWNIIDGALHIALGMVEPWRLAGNIVGIVIALFVIVGTARPYAPYLLSAAAAVVVLLNAVHSALHDWLAPSFVFIGVSVFLLLFIAQKSQRQASSHDESAQNPIYLRWWAALVATILGIVMIALVGDQGELDLSRADRDTNAVVTANAPGDRILMLSAGIEVENITDIPETAA